MTSPDEAAESEEFERVLADIERLAHENREADVLALCEKFQKRFQGRFELHYHKAQAHALLRNPVGALADISTAIALQPTEPALFFFRGLWNVNADRLPEGVDDLTRAIALEQTLGRTYYSESAQFLRAIASLPLGNFDQAIADCDLVRADMTTFAHGRVWKAADVRELAGQRRKPPW